jgi:hypothetical protein
MKHFLRWLNTGSRRVGESVTRKLEQQASSLIDVWRELAKDLHDWMNAWPVR